MRSKSNSSDIYVMSPAQKRELEIQQAKKVARIKEERQKQAEFLQSLDSMTPEEQLVALKKQELIQRERMHNEQLLVQAEQLKLQNQQLAAQNNQVKLQQAQYDAMKKCPKCGSTSISGNQKGYGVVKGALGGAVGFMINPVGAAIGLGVGNIGKKRVYCTCMSCGYRWKAGKK